MLFFPIIFAVALFVTYLSVPVVRRFARKISAVDLPNDRKVHRIPIPRLGGIAIYAGFLAATAVSIILSNFWGVKINLSLIGGITLGATLLLIVGVVDDLRSLRPTTKLIFQIIAAAIIIYFGAEINFISSPFNGIVPIGALAIPLTLLWVVGLTNAINLIDGLDGLASGVTAISSMTLFFVALRTHQIEAAILVLILAGAALGFLRYNFFPASIFLGDSGAMFFGFILAAASIIGVFKTTLVVALIVPILILGVPIFDTLFAIGRRLKERRHPFEADAKHIHHLLLRAGFNKREAVLAIYLACFLLSFMALIMALQK